MGQSIPLVCQDWANTKAAYRFFSNDRVSEADILAGHFRSTRDRAAATEDLVLVLHDTTEFSYQREKSEAIGITKSINNGRDKAGRLRSHTVCGILMHSSSRLQSRGCRWGWRPLSSGPGRNSRGRQRLKRRSVRPGFPSRKRKASGGWKISSSLRNSWIVRDDASILVIARVTSTNSSAQHRRSELILIRTCVDRLAGDGDHTIADEMDEVAVKGLHRIEVRDSNGDPGQAVLEIRYRKIRVLPPIGK
ncbi:hypothetical protein M2232_008512 [Bradyrhizobium japonicum]|nr:hypothetical protein [Bradyrhizobium japonicum]MCS3986551.1 hypothetical protein [Bradyrhizobium japonicum]MCS4018635.1 hypothetical protein [Bradyrhizobium japonicum]MCS4205739.1 hypothetical protein [Bradyrhizobium japonicum]MCW2224980.1 hypothetical protein [Bradyrhizobium japonicum]